MDFGIATRVNGGAARKEADVAGSPAYMAPEAVRGEPVTPLMDVYAAGLVMGELLRGKPLAGWQRPHHGLATGGTATLATAAGFARAD
jgi:serine/threonine protein kinase